MGDELTKAVLAMLCIVTSVTSMFFCMTCVSQRTELKFLRQIIADKEQTIDEQNSTIVKLLEHIKYLRGE